ncbi:LmrA/YxaF family transcription factor [Planktothrix agardhii]|uniref:LmrA/YxaF family transcription factor n=1 Tax=Planktothrix agardhii TaxID=1160 RepID=UPI003872D7DC
MGDRTQVQQLFEVWIAAIAAVLMAEGMEENVAKQQAEKAVILVQGSLILSQGLNDVKIFKRIVGNLPKELLLS